MKSPDICLGVWMEMTLKATFLAMKLNTTSNLIRLSVGCEPIEYLLNDLSDLIAPDEQRRKACNNSRSVGH